MRPWMFVLLWSFSAACTRQPPPQPHASSAKPVGSPLEIRPALGLPPVPVPADNPPTAETVALGRDLFHDKRLSADQSISCASCHEAANSFADPRARSQGVGKKEGNRNAPPVMNAAFHSVQFWDGRAATLEEQAGGPIANPVEMNLSHEQAVERVTADPAYRERFAKAFGPGPVTMDKVTKAIASFERTLIAGDTPFDRYFYGGDKSALSEEAIRGLELFRDPKLGNCAACHTIGERFALFTDGKFHNVGAGLSNEGEIVDHGRFAVTKQEADRGAFRTPTLRNIARTAPYMHDGSLRTLRQVVDFYIGGGSSNPYLDKEIKPLRLKGEQRVELVAFLEALSSPAPAQPEGKP